MRVKFLAAITFAFALVCECVSGGAAPTKAFAASSRSNNAVEAPDYEYTIEKEASFSGEEDDLTFDNGAAILVDGDSYYLIGPDGKQIIKNEEIIGVESVGDGYYIVIVKDGKDEVNKTGLVDKKGKVLIPFDAAFIKYTTDDPKDAMFLEVGYAMEETTDKSQCFVYSADNDYSLGPDEDDTMYKGYGEVFSLDEEEMVKGIRITNGSRTAFNDLQDAFTVEDDDDTTTMYNAKGKKLWESPEKSTVYMAKNAVIVSSSSGQQLIDSSGKVSYETKGYLHGLNGDDKRFTEKNDDEVTVIDIEGKQVLDKSYDKVTYASGGLYDVGSGSDEAIVDGSGKVVVEYSSGYTLKEVVPGYCVSRANNEYVVIKSGKQIVSLKNGVVDNLVFKDDSDKYYVLNDEKFNLEIRSVSELAPALARARMNDSAGVGLYDLFTGKQLLEDEYEEIHIAGDYIYAFADGTWTTYELELKD